MQNNIFQLKYIKIITRDNTSDILLLISSVIVDVPLFVVISVEYLYRVQNFFLRFPVSFSDQECKPYQIFPPVFHHYWTTLKL